MKNRGCVIHAMCNVRLGCALPALVSSAVSRVLYRSIAIVFAGDCSFSFVRLGVMRARVRYRRVASAVGERCCACVVGGGGVGGDRW
jgi:hypothetical protein